MMRADVYAYTQGCQMMGPGHLSYMSALMCSCSLDEQDQNILAALVSRVSIGRVIVLVPVSCMP